MEMSFWSHSQNRRCKLVHMVRQLSLSVVVECVERYIDFIARDGFAAFCAFPIDWESSLVEWGFGYN